MKAKELIKILEVFDPEDEVEVWIPTSVLEKYSDVAAFEPCVEHVSGNILLTPGKNVMA